MIHAHRLMGASSQDELAKTKRKKEEKMTHDRQ
jgi:hypothetical protein